MVGDGGGGNGVVDLGRGFVDGGGGPGGWPGWVMFRCGVLFNWSVAREW